MSSQNAGITRRLIRGQRNMDRKKIHGMQVEIKMLVGMILGLISPTPRPSNHWVWHFGFQVRLGNGWWELEQVDGSLYVICQVPGERGPICGFTSWRSERQFMFEGVTSSVHESLDAFVEGMKNIFPELESAIQPFLLAAEEEF